MRNIDWTPPQPREGLAGMWDKFVGPGATRSEEILQLLGGVLLMIALSGLLFIRRDALDWSLLQVILAALLIFDLIGGIITNATATAKRWYHRDGHDSFASHLPFIATHGFHLAVIAFLFRDGDWMYFLVLYGYLIGGTVLITRVALYLQRPLAMMLYAGVLLIGIYVFEPTPGLEWFIPFFFLKLLISHLLTEAPYTVEQPT